MIAEPPPNIQQERRGFFARWRMPIFIGLGLALVLGLWAFFPKINSTKHKAPVRMVEILPPLPPPPPPPPPPQDTPPPEKAPEFQQETQPEEKPPEQPPEQPPEAPLGTNIEGEGNDGFNLGHGPGNGTRLGGNGDGGNRSKWGWYAGEVQRDVVTALRGNKVTRSSKLGLEARIWADSTGRVTRATLSGSSGNAATDAAIRDQILTGLQLDSAPPAGMPMPIVLRITARRPN